MLAEEYLTSGPPLNKAPPPSNSAMPPRFLVYTVKSGHQIWSGAEGVSEAPHPYTVGRPP